jgi:hypothetical protein
MSCVLRIIGKDLDIDTLLAASNLVPYKKMRKGQPRSALKVDGKKMEHSGICIKVSDANFNEFSRQIEDAILYLQTNNKQLKIIASTKEVEFAILDFGVDLRIDNNNVLLETHRLPADLLALAGNLGISIEVSVYSRQIGHILEKRSKKNKKIKRFSRQGYKQKPTLL